MIDRKYLLGLFSIILITTIFAEGKRTLWDFGVTIQPSVKNSVAENNKKTYSNTEIEPSAQVKAMIANPFIPPTLNSLNKKAYDLPTVPEPLDKIPLNNIHQVKLLAGRLTMQINYLPIIDMISQIDFSQLDGHDCLELNYWLANAFLHTGQFTEAEDIILANRALRMDDRFHFLLAMTYEAQGKVKNAREEYLRFIKQFPKSDYTVTALIKARMLGRR